MKYIHTIFKLFYCLKLGGTEWSTWERPSPPGKHNDRNHPLVSPESSWSFFPRCPHRESRPPDPPSCPSRGTLQTGTWCCRGRSTPAPSASRIPRLRSRKRSASCWGVVVPTQCCWGRGASCPGTLLSRSPWRTLSWPWGRHQGRIYPSQTAWNLPRWCQRSFPSWSHGTVGDFRFSHHIRHQLLWRHHFYSPCLRDGNPSL